MKISISELVFTKFDIDHIKVVSIDDNDEFYYVINGHYQNLWRLMAEKKTRNELLLEFALELNVSHEEISDEVYSFIDELIEMNLIIEK